ncbi:MAG: hypothetical protein AB8C84_00610 [Oligoflexales bacterium]
MASATKKLKVRRLLTIARRARKRKNHVNRFGTTAPSLPLNVPNANEKAMLAAR